MDSMPEINVSPSKSAAGSTAASFKAAGSLVAKKAERTKLVTVTLPRAYADLGKSVYKDDALRAGFAELFKGIDELLAQRKQIIEAGKARPSGNGLADKARKAAADATDMAKSKAIDLQAFQAFAKLGEEVYQQHKDDAGLADAIKPIAVAVSRRDQLDRDTATIQKDSKGHWLTPKRIAWGVGIFIGLGVLGSILDPDKKGGGGGGADGGGGGRGGAEATTATGPADPGGEAMAVLRQCWIGTTPESVESLMNGRGFEKARTENKTIEGKPNQFHTYEPGEVGFAFGRNQSTGNWGLILARINGQGYFAPVSPGTNPIRMK